MRVQANQRWRDEGGSELETNVNDKRDTERGRERKRGGTLQCDFHVLFCVFLCMLQLTHEHHQAGNDIIKKTDHSRTMMLYFSFSLFCPMY